MKRRGFLAGSGAAFATGTASLLLPASADAHRRSQPAKGSAALFGDGFEPAAMITDRFNVSGFGSRDSSAWFEDFETFAAGPARSPLGRLRLSNAGGQTISTALAFHGRHSLQNTYSANDFPKNHLELSGTRPRFYFCCQLHYRGSPAGAHVWKQGRIGAGEVYGGIPRAGESWTSGSMLPSGFGGEIVNSDGITSWSAHNDVAPDAEQIYDLDRWMFYEFEHDSGSVGQADSVTRATVDGVPVLVWNQRPYLTAASPTLPQWFLTPMNGLDGAPAITVNMDQAYADESRARVVFTDAADYRASTRYNVQPILDYADTQLRTQRNAASFASGEQVHVHAWTAGGDYRPLGPYVLD